MDSMAELKLFEKRELRSNRSRSKKPWKQEGFLNKVIIGNIEQPEILDSTTRRLPNDNCGQEWATNVHYSLKKKRRWSILNDLRSNIEAWNDDDDSSVGKPMVTALETRVSWVRRKEHDGKCTAYHGVEIDGEDFVPVHRYPCRAYGNESTLTQKPKVPKPKKPARHRQRRSTNDRRPLAIVVDEEPEPEAPVAKLQYNVTMVQDQEKFERYQRQLDRKYLHWAGGHRVHRHRCETSRRLLDEFLVGEDYGFDQSDEEVTRVGAENVEAVDTAHSESAELPQEADQHSYAPPSLMPIDLADLAFLRSVKADSKKCRHPRRHRHSISEFLFEDHAVLSGPSKDFFSSNEPSPSSSLPSKFISDDYFQMIPAEVFSIADSIEESQLQQAYGNAYYEAACVPRRFVIDISTASADLLRSVYGPRALNLDIRILCVCEVIPPILQASLLDEDNHAAVPMKVWINGYFAKCAENLYIDTINPCIPQTLEGILLSAVNAVGTLPLDWFNELPVTSANTRIEAAGQLLVGASATCFELPEMTTKLLEQGDMLKKVQRQLTAVACYDWYSNMNENICFICLEELVEEVGFCLSDCRHWFCIKCWRLYCMERILNGFGQLTCPYPKCDTPIDYYLLTTFVPLPICQTYGEQLRDQCISKNSKQWFWCPNAKCGRLTRLADDSRIPAVICACGSFWCTKCSKASHWPAACHLAKLYIKKLKDRQDDPTLLDGVAITEKKIHSVDVKRCPHCKILMEKGEGCIASLADVEINFAGVVDNGGRLRIMETVTGRKSRMDLWTPTLSRLTGIEDHTPCVHIPLIDVHQAFSSQLREMFYERALAHRMAARSRNQSKLRQTMLVKCWNVTPRHLKNLSMAGFPENDWNSCRADQHQLVRHVRAVAAYMQRFFEVHHQAHYLLEFVYVHWQFCNRRVWADMKGLKWMVDRLEFALERMEDFCKAGNLQKVDEFVARVDNLLQLLLKEVSTDRFGKSDLMNESSKH